MVLFSKHLVCTWITSLATHDPKDQVQFSQIDLCMSLFISLGCSLEGLVHFLGFLFMHRFAQFCLILIQMAVHFIEGNTSIPLVICLQIDLCTFYSFIYMHLDRINLGN
jgi:hypothetical protein